MLIWVHCPACEGEGSIFDMLAENAEAYDEDTDILMLYPGMQLNLCCQNCEQLWRVELSFHETAEAEKEEP